MKILVINISLRPDSRVKLVPIGLAYILTAMKNARLEFQLLDIDAHRLSDAQVEILLQKEDYDVVCMGCIVTGYKIVKRLAAQVRRQLPNAVIVAGNSVATSVVDTLLTSTEVDIAVIGEGDQTIVDLLETIANHEDLSAVKGICFKTSGQITRTASRPLIKDLSSLPFVDFSLFDIERYIETSRHTVGDPLPFPREQTRALPINTARGCIADCTFCYHVFKGLPYRYRKPESIVAEIEEMLMRYNLNYISLWDDLSFFSKKQVSEFCEKILNKGLKFNWAGSCRGNLFTKESDLHIMELIKRAGCIRMAYALESADETILRDMKKQVSVEQFTRQTTLFRKAGIHVVTSLVFGFPQETPETIRKTLDCCIENKIYPTSGYLLPQPGSKMYQYAIDHEYITDEENYLLSMGDRQDLRINMTQMSDEEFEMNVTEGLKRCNARLDIGLDESNLIKTQYYRAKQKLI